MRAIRFTFSLGLAMLLALEAAHAGALVGGERYSRGNSDVAATRADGASVAVWSTSKIADSILNKELAGTVLRKTSSFAKVNLEAHSAGGSKARVLFAGSTVYSKDITGSGGSFKMDPRLYNVFVIKPTVVWVWGPVSIWASAQAGAGVQFGGTWRLEPSTPKADLVAAAQVWGYGSGSVSAKILAGLADLSVSATLNFFNTTLKISAYASPSGFAASQCWMEVIPWELYVKLKGKVLWDLWTVWSKTIVSEKGDSRTYRFF